MDRDEFMELVYETFADEPDNVLANGIIEAADAYVEYEKAQLFSEGTTKGTTSDLISRQAAIDEIKTVYEWHDTVTMERLIEHLNNLPTVQPEPHGGHWVDGRCNKCGGQAPFYVMASTYYESDFCPHCGAKMKGERQK